MKVFKEFTPEVTRLLKFGAVGVIPTDTVYGIATPLLQMYSVRKLASLKRRPVDKPIGTILIDSLSQIEDIVHSSLLQKATMYWPGPVSVVLPVWSEMIYAHKSKVSLPFRMPDNPVLRELVAQTGPLATTSFMSMAATFLSVKPRRSFALPKKGKSRCYVINDLQNDNLYITRKRKLWKFAHFESYQNCFDFGDLIPRNDKPHDVTKVQESANKLHHAFSKQQPLVLRLLHYTRSKILSQSISRRIASTRPPSKRLLKVSIILFLFDCIFL